MLTARKCSIWGNYCNVSAEPHRSTSTTRPTAGETVQIAYSFGQNPATRTMVRRRRLSGTLLGDANNAVICRHIHCVAYNPTRMLFTLALATAIGQGRVSLVARHVRRSADALGLEGVGFRGRQTPDTSPAASISSTASSIGSPMPTVRSHTTAGFSVADQPILLTPRRIRCCSTPNTNRPTC